MKFLIWFGCALVLSLITVSLKYVGILLGFIPTFILGSLMFWSARTLCKKWDQRKSNKKPITIKKQIREKSCDRTVKIVCVVMSIVAMILLIVSFILQDEKRNYYEDVAPSMYYIVLFFNYLLLTISMLFQKNKKYNVFQSVVATALLLISIYITIEGSFFSKEYVKYTSNYYGNYVRKYVDYQNANMVFLSDVMVLVLSFVECSIILIPSIKVLFNKITSKYYMSMKYREKCYKKVADMQSYLEKGIITQEEFEKNKNDILKKINNTKSNKTSQLETSKEEDVVGDIISVQNEELTSEKVKTEKLGNLTDEEWEYFYKTDFEKFWEKVLEEYDLSKLPDRIMSLRDETMVYGEDARKMYLSRLKGVVEYSEWMTKNHPEVINNQWNTIKELKKELQEKTSGEVYMLDVIRNYEDKYIRY